MAQDLQPRLEPGDIALRTGRRPEIRAALEAHTVQSARQLVALLGS